MERWTYLELPTGHNAIFTAERSGCSARGDRLTDVDGPIAQIETAAEMTANHTGVRSRPAIEEWWRSLIKPTHSLPIGVRLPASFGAQVLGNVERRKGQAGEPEVKASERLRGFRAKTNLIDKLRTSYSDQTEGLEGKAPCAMLTRTSGRCRSRVANGGRPATSLTNSHARRAHSFITRHPRPVCSRPG